MKLKRIIALLLSLAFVFCLAACGSSGTSSEGTSDSSESSASELGDGIEYEEEDETLALAMEDVVSYLTNGAYSADTVVATVGDQDITAAEALYYVAYEQYDLVYYYFYYYYYYYGTEYIVAMDDTWSDDMTVGEFIYSLGMQDAVANTVAALKCEEMGLSLSEDDLAEIATFTDIDSYGQDRWDTFLEAGLINEDDFTEEAKEAWIQEYGYQYLLHSLGYFSTDPAGIQAVYEKVYLYNLLQETLFGEDGEYAPTEERLNEYVGNSDYMWARCILFSTMDCEDDDEVAEVKATAESVLDELSGLEGDELEDRFTELQAEYDTSGYTAGEVQMYALSEASSYVDGYIDAIDALDIGSVGITDETSYGYFVLIREANEPEDMEDDYISDTYSDLINQWIEEYGAVCEMPDLDLTTYYELLDDLQILIYNTDNVSSEAEDTEEAETEDAAVTE